jgi:hypothetical protein
MKIEKAIVIKAIGGCARHKSPPVQSHISDAETFFYVVFSAVSNFCGF